jgi:hypothetical protein
MSVSDKNPLIVKILTDGDLQPRALLTRNQEGDIPLNMAVNGSFTKITRMLLDAAARANLDIEVESGLGDTPLEVARQQYWLHKTRDLPSMGAHSQPTLLSSGYSRSTPKTPDIDVMAIEKRATFLKEILADLARNGELAQGSPVTAALSDFVARLDKHVNALRAVSAAKKDKDVSMEVDKESKEESELRGEHISLEETFAIVRAAYGSRPLQRKLVRLDDVQKAVRVELDKRQHAAEEARAEQAQAKEREGGLFEGQNDEESDDEDRFSGFSEFDFYKAGDWRSRSRRLAARRRRY